MISKEALNILKESDKMWAGNKARKLLNETWQQNRRKRTMRKNIKKFMAAERKRNL